jgi:hypothetical protein
MVRLIDMRVIEEKIKTNFISTKEENFISTHTFLWDLHYSHPWQQRKRRKRKQKSKTATID